MKDKSIVVQRIKSHYVGEDCIQVMVPYEESCVIFNLNDIQYLDHKNNGFINKYTEDERRKQFPYHNITQHHLDRYITVANQIYEFNKPYLEIRFGEMLESYVVKDGDEALLSTKQLDIKNPEKTVVTRKQLEELVDGQKSGENANKHYIVQTNGMVLHGLDLLSEKELVDKVIKNGILEQKFFVVDLDGKNINLKVVNVKFKGYHDEFEVEVYHVSIKNYTYEEIKYLSKDIKEAKEPKIKTRFNKGITKETIEEQKRLVLSKVNNPKK